MAENTREIVLDTLLEMERSRIYSNQMIKAVLDKYDYLEGQDKRFIKRLAEGCVERKIELDYVLNLYSTVPVNRMKPLIRCLLRMSVYQILYMERSGKAGRKAEIYQSEGVRQWGAAQDHFPERTDSFAG